MMAEIVKWVPATATHEAYGFAKPATSGARDVLVSAGRIIAGKPFVGATIECKTHVGINGRAKAYDVRVLSSGA
jgi:hypothetical protein